MSGTFRKFKVPSVMLRSLSDKTKGTMRRPSNIWYVGRNPIPVLIVLILKEETSAGCNTLSEVSLQLKRVNVITYRTVQDTSSRNMVLRT